MLALQIIYNLGEKRVNGKVVYYELICGIDYRFLTEDIATALKGSRFRNLRFAWDWGFKDQFRVRDGLKKLLKAGYKPKDIMVFMICNWKIPFSECMLKLNICKYWNVQVADCYFDGQVSPNIKPVFWNEEEIKTFRHEVRKHNQIVNFGCDPELRESQQVQTELKAEV